jgi:Spy/CpxP family protein refolding chaperone
MKFKRTMKTALFTAMVLMVGTAVAFAHGGWGGGRGEGRGPMMNYQGDPTMGPGGNGPFMRGYGGQNRLTEEEMAKLEPIREKFLAETEALRLNINEKQFALSQEMIKQSPDEKKALQLQKELSELRSQFQQKAFAHRLEVRKLLPEKNFGPGMGRGYGRGKGGRGGFCW